MVETRLLRDLAESIRKEPTLLLAQWMEEFMRRSWTLRSKFIHERAIREVVTNGSKVTCPGGEAPLGTEKPPLELLRSRCELFLATLSDTLMTAQKLEAGTPEFREPIQILSFVAGWMAGNGIAATDAVALVHSLQAVLGGPHDEFYKALIVVVTEAYCAALTQKAQACYRDAMEKSQLICILHPSLPCLFLVGDPDLQALDDAMGRLMMLAIMRESKALIIDVSGLFHPEKIFGTIFQRMSDEIRSLPAQVCFSGISPELQRQRASALSSRISIHETLHTALSEAAKQCGLSWPTN